MRAAVGQDALLALVAAVASEPTAEICSRQLNGAERSRQLLTALTGLVIELVAAARHPEFAAFSERSQSLSGCADAVGTVAERGFFRDAARPQTLVCFHCAAESVGDGLGAAPNAGAEHRGDCAVARLGRLLSQPGNGCLATEASRAEAALRQLRQLLARPAVPLAESFGFQRNLLAWALARNLADPDGAAPADRAGQLMPLADLCEAQFHRSEHLLRRPPLEALLADAGDSTTAASTTSGQSAAAAVVAAPAPSDEAPVAASLTSAGTVSAAVPDGDDQCLRCRRRQRSRVLLPCAHLALCDACLDGARSCPACGASALASVKAFIC